MEKHYTVKEVAELLGLTEQTIRRKLKTNEIESVRIGSMRRIPDSCLDRYLRREVRRNAKYTR